MSSRALEAKHERILKELVRRPENKRCADCDTTGPSYAVTNFNTFVCTVCGGVHRQFGHRVKGITMASFKPEEIAALQAGGNQECHRFYLARWEVKDLAKPLDRTPQKIKDWIEAVYVKKRYFSEDAPPVKPAANGTAAQPKRPTIEVPKAPAPAATSVTSPTGPSAAAAPFDPFGDASPPSTTNSASNEPAWADFGAPTPSALPSAPAPTPAAGAPQGGGWAAFGQPPTDSAPPPAAAPGVTAAAPPAPAAAGWQAFGTNGTSTEAAGPAVPAAPPAPAPEPAKPAPPKELPLELFSEVQRLGIPGYAAPPSGYGASGTYPPTFAATVHATAGYGAPPPPTMNAPYSGSYQGSGYAGQYAAPAPSPAAGYASQGFAQPYAPTQSGYGHPQQYAAPSPAGPPPGVHDSFSDLGQSFRAALPSTGTGAPGGNPFA